MKQYNILFLCTHNSARSILGEALASTHPSGKFKGFSAGSTPGTHVNPIAQELAVEIGMDKALLKSKSWDVYGEPNAPQMDFIITVCDNANEACPVFPSKAKKFHQNFPDPAKALGKDKEIMNEFRKVRGMIKEYCRIFVAENL